MSRPEWEASRREWHGGEGREAWDHRRAIGRVHTYLDLVAESARSGARADLKGTQLEADLKEGKVNPYQAAADRDRP